MRRTGKQVDQLKLGLEWAFWTEIAGREESIEAFEDSSKALRKKRKTAEPSSILSAITGRQEEAAY